MLGLLAVALLSAGGINIDQSTIKTFTDCPANGLPAAQTLSGGDWLMTVTGEDTSVCFTDSASTCASGGSLFPTGSVVKISIGAGGKSTSCRSAGGTGDLQFTKAS